jgi:tetratricopeptide (TPR) repeat protein
MKFPTKNFPTALSWILGISFCLHAVYLYQLMSTPYFQVPLVDAAWYHKEALKILDQGWIGDSVFFMAPFYQYFLAIFYELFGVKIGLILILQAILSVASVWLIYIFSARLFSQLVGILSAALATFHGTFIFYSGFLLKANLSLFLTSLFLVVLLKTCDTPTFRNFFWCGLILGILVPIRGNFLIVIAVLSFWFFFFPLRKSLRWKNTFAFFLGAALFITPFTIRNYYVSGDFVLVNSAAGFNFFIGNNPIANGYNIAPSYIRLTPFYEEVDSKKRAEIVLGRTLKASEVSDYWMGQGLKFVREQPLEFFILQIKKFLIFINNSEKGDNYDINFMKQFTPIIHIGIIPYGAILLLTIISLYWGRWSSPHFVGIYLFIISYSLSVVIFFVKSRYRIPVVPAMIPLAAFALLEGRNKISKMSKREITILSIVFIALTIAIFRPIKNDNQSAKLNDYGVALETKGFLNEAIGHYKKALDTPPVHRRAALNLALAYYQKKDTDKAIEFSKKALEIDEKFVEARLFLASILYAQKNFDAASKHYKEILKEEPNNTKAHSQLGGIYLFAKKFGLAEEEFRLSLKYDKNPASSYNNLGMVYLGQGKFEQAKEYFNNALKHNPDLVEANYNLGTVFKLQGFPDKAQNFFQPAKQLKKPLPNMP